jgi:hypothetical protein
VLATVASALFRNGAQKRKTRYQLQFAGERVAKIRFVAKELDHSDLQTPVPAMAVTTTSARQAVCGPGAAIHSEYPISDLLLRQY